MNEFENEQFTIDNDVKAEWTLKKIVEIETEYNRLNDICQEQINFYQAKQATYLEQRNNDRSGLIGMLAQYFEGVNSKATKTQATYKLPSGKLVKKLEKKDFKQDAEKLLEILKDTFFVENKPSLKWGEYKKTLQIVDDKVIDEYGEIVEGVTVETKAASFDVSLEV